MAEHMYSGSERGSSPVKSNDFSILIEKSHSTRVSATLSSWKGRHLVHVREHTPGALPDSWWPTSKGAALPVEKLPELIAALETVRLEAIARGVLKQEEVQAAA
jgi:hypothetical protein